MRREFLLLLFILGLGVFLRVYNIQHTLLFHFDQGYHGLAIKEIWETKRLALLGHKTDVEGIFHGSTFYYLMLPFYLFSGWDPAKVSSLLAIIDGFAIIFVFLIGKEMFDKRAGLLAALFYAVSYSLVSYARWLSNVTLIPFFSTVFFYSLLRAYQGKLKFLPLAFFCAGLITQFNGAIGFFFLPLLVFSLYRLRKKLFSKKLYLLISMIFFLLPILPLVFFEFRHNFLVSRSILHLFLQQDTSGLSFQRVFSNFTLLKSELVNLFSYKLPVVTLALFILTLFAAWWSWFKNKKEFSRLKKLLIFLLLPIAGLFFYQKGIHGFFFVGTLPLFILFVSWGLSFWWEKTGLRLPIAVFILFLILLNLYYWQGFLKPGFNLVPIGTRNLITLEDRKKAVDFIYNNAGGKSFNTSIYIIPYSQYQPWDYVFSWYGEDKYGFLQSEFAGESFVIYEPDYDFPYRLDSWLGKIGEDHGQVVASFKAHDLTVEKRER